MMLRYQSKMLNINYAEDDDDALILINDASSILICWHVKVGDQETCGLTSQAMDGDHSDWCSSEKLNHRHKDQ